MRRRALEIAKTLSLAAALWPGLAPAENDRDFVFTDTDGYLVIRFVNLVPGDLTGNQRDEVLDQEFSTMIHDRLRADLRFEAEAIDDQWAHPTEHRIRNHLSALAPDFTSIDIRCRSASCRIILEHTSRLSIAEHQALMSRVQTVIQTFVDADSSTFDPGFMMTGYDQESETPHVKVFLRRRSR